MSTFFVHFTSIPYCSFARNLQKQSKPPKTIPKIYFNPLSKLEKRQKNPTLTYSPHPRIRKNIPRPFPNDGNFTRQHTGPLTTLTYTVVVVRSIPPPSRTCAHVMSAGSREAPWRCDDVCSLLCGEAELPAIIATRHTFYCGRANNFAEAWQRPRTSTVPFSFN